MFCLYFSLQLLPLFVYSDPRVVRESLNCSQHVPWQSLLVTWELHYENDGKLWTMNVVMVVHIIDCPDTSFCDL